MPLSYGGLAEAIQTGRGLEGTIEFFPEEGKYHMDGHRKCGLCLNPQETLGYQGICPVCGRKITIGVSHRVEELADRPEGYVREGAKPFESLVPLAEVIGASVGHSSTSKKVQQEYLKMLQKLGPEFEILRKVPGEEICRVSGSRVAEGIDRLRKGQVERIPGFDGEYGAIRLFGTDELQNTEGQMNFFSMLDITRDEKVKEKQKTGSTEQKIKKVMKEPKESAKEGIYGLNQEQTKAACSSGARIAVMAGPGTGKTKTLVSRLRYLLEYRRVHPGEITAVTFTNQAAEEMRERIRRQTGKKQTVRQIQIGTFHGICLKFLRQQNETFLLAGEAKQQKIAQEAVWDTGADISVGELRQWISYQKSGMDISAVQMDAAKMEICRQVFSVYEKKKRELRMLDFDDLLLRTVERIKEGQVQEGWEKPFRYLLVDEFQDISPIQYQLVRLWSKKGRELFVIGDPDQSIYGFRGADGECFEHLKEGEPKLREIRLRENYRSSPQILGAAFAVITEEETNWEKAEERRLHANCQNQAPVRLVRASGPMAEGIFIAKEINRMAGGIGMLEAHQAVWERDGNKVRSFDEIAVLCRTHHQAELVEKCLKTEGIPCMIVGREDYLKAETVKNSLAFFRAMEYEEDEMAWKLCAEYFWKMEWSPVAQEVVRKTAEGLQPLYQKRSPEDFLEVWMEIMHLAKDPDMQKLCQAAVFYSSMPEFIEALELGEEGDVKRCGDKTYESGSVMIMTIHGSKGLEFPVVFLYGVEEGVIPLEREGQPSNRDEERRLLYVGITRAKEELILTTSGEPSMFLRKLPDGFLKEETAGKKKSVETWHQMSLFEIDPDTGEGN